MILMLMVVLYEESRETGNNPRGPYVVRDSQLDNRIATTLRRTAGCGDEIPNLVLVGSTPTSPATSDGWQ